jgi:hypothetical protein
LEAGVHLRPDGRETVGWSGCRLLTEARNPALRRLAAKSCASNALPANPAEFHNISRRVLCFSKNFGLIFVGLSNVDYVPDILRRYCGPNKITINDVSRSMTQIHLRRRVHQHRKPEEWESVRRERYDFRDQAVLDSKNVQRQRTPGGIAGLAHVSCDRRLQVGVGHNAVEATKSSGAEPLFDP